MSGGDVQETLNELERRLRELQAELGVSAPEEPAGGTGAPPPMPPYRAPEPQPAPPPPPVVPAPPPPPSPLQDQLDELVRFRDQLAAAADALVEDYSRVLEQIQRALDAGAPLVPPPPPTPAAGHATFPVPPPAPASSEGTLHSGHVTIEAAPFGDIAALAAFEAALRQVPHAQDVAVRSFDEGRAVLEVRLAAEVPLVFELRRASDRPFTVGHVEPGRLVLEVQQGDLPFPMRP